MSGAVIPDGAVSLAGGTVVVICTGDYAALSDFMRHVGDA